MNNVLHQLFQNEGGPLHPSFSHFTTNKPKINFGNVSSHSFPHPIFALPVTYKNVAVVSVLT